MSKTRAPRKARKPSTPKNPCCSFCGDNLFKVDFLVEHGRVNICGSCVKICVAIIAERRAEREAEWASRIKGAH